MVAAAAEGWKWVVVELVMGLTGGLADDSTDSLGGLCRGFAMNRDGSWRDGLCRVHVRRHRRGHAGPWLYLRGDAVRIYLLRQTNGRVSCASEAWLSRFVTGR